MLRRALLSVLIVAGCADSAVKSPGGKKSVQVRYRNLSQEEIMVLETELFDSLHVFRNIAAGAVTDFVKVPRAHAYHYARVITAKDTLVVQPIDAGPEQVYSQGYMTLDLDIIANGDGSRQLVYARNGAAPVRDHHTTASDVIDNLFVFINAKDWKVVQDFYAPGAVSENAQGSILAGTPVQYFQELFITEDINYIYVAEQKTSGNEVFVKAMTRKGARSAEYPYCYNFTITNNRIARQQAVNCTR
jgi:hypothetical protein